MLAIAGDGPYLACRTWRGGLTIACAGGSELRLDIRPQAQRGRLVSLPPEGYRAVTGLALPTPGSSCGVCGAAFTPENVLGYIYALLSSTTYREAFEGALEDDFPRIPFTTDSTSFELVATEGMALVRLHLLEDLTVTLPRIEGAGDLSIGNARYDEATNELWINDTQHVGPVTPAVWEARVGSHQVLELWLRNHAGRRLGRDEAADLARIIGSLSAAEARRPDIEALVEDLLEGEIVVV